MTLDRDYEQREKYNKETVQKLVAQRSRILLLLLRVETDLVGIDTLRLRLRLHVCHILLTDLVLQMRRQILEVRHAAHRHSDCCALLLLRCGRRRRSRRRCLLQTRRLESKLLLSCKLAHRA